MTGWPATVHNVTPRINGGLKNALRLACETLTATGLADVADCALAQLSAPRGNLSVVVAGELNRGKSSLVNALLAHPDASPVGADIAPWAFVRFVSPEDSTAQDFSRLLFGSAARSISPADLPDWLTVGGRHVCDPAVDQLPIGAEVAIGCPFLPQIALVDTPAVGSLSREKLRLATTAVTEARVLLMACDVTAPPSAAELGFLREAGGDFDAVVIAITKIDKNPRRWRTIIAENRRLLRKHAPGFAGAAMIGVSSRVALAALKTDTTKGRRSALRASGIAELVGHLREISAAADTVRAVNGLQIARTGLDRVVAQVLARRSAMTAGAGAADQLAARKRALRQRWGGDWGHELRRETETARDCVRRMLFGELNALEARWTAILDNTRIEQLTNAPQLLVAELTVELQALLTEVDEWFAHELVAVAKALALPGDLSPVSDPSPLTITGISEVRDELTPQRLAAAAAESGRKGVQRWLYRLLAAVAMTPTTRSPARPGFSARCCCTTAGDMSTNRWRSSKS